MTGPASAPAGRLLPVVAYAGVLLCPLALAAAAVKPGAQGRLVVFADALGFAAISALALQVVVSGRWSVTTRRLGLRRILSLHRQAGMAVVVIVVGHVVVLMVDDPARLALLDVTTAPGRARAGVVAVLGLAALAVTSAWRQRLRLSYQRWRGVHLALTTVVIAASCVHVLEVDAYMSLPVVRWSILGLVLAAAAGLFWARVIRPYSTALRPYRVIAVERERGGAVTVELQADGHGGLRFAPGQFARLRPAHRPYGLDDHPFTLSSSADLPERPAFTVKALGDFSGSVGRLAIGTEILVDGPHGEAIDAPRAGQGRLLLAAGIGITPAMSVLRTAAHRGDRRPLLLLYGSRRWADVTFREELADLERRLANLRVIHVLSRPDPAWQGERGRIDEALLRRYAPPDPDTWSALVCGPPAMVSDASRALVRLGMAPTAVQAEGFE
jgi:predicted ferric reductase